MKALEITLLIKSILGLIAILGVLVLFWIFSSRAKEELEEEKPSEEIVKKESLQSFEALKEIIDNKKSTSQELASASEAIIKYYGTMPHKLGMRINPDAEVYLDILFKLARHKKTNKTIVIKFNKELEKLNPGYKKEINDALMKGLNSRGF